jgi:cytochrome P450
MTLYPEVQAKAQTELARVLGDPHSPDHLTRLPTLSDRDNLPYISAIVKEVWRWNPSVPLGKAIHRLQVLKLHMLNTDFTGLPHVATQDDVYRGFHIEKGATVWANIWSGHLIFIKSYLLINRPQGNPPR